MPRACPHRRSRGTESGPKSDRGRSRDRALLRRCLNSDHRRAGWLSPGDWHVMRNIAQCAVVFLATVVIAFVEARGSDDTGHEIVEALVSDRIRSNTMCLSLEIQRDGVEPLIASLRRQFPESMISREERVRELMEAKVATLFEEYETEFSSAFLSALQPHEIQFLAAGRSRDPGPDRDRYDALVRVGLDAANDIPTRSVLAFSDWILSDFLDELRAMNIPYPELSQKREEEIRRAGRVGMENARSRIGESIEHRCLR